jgi:hypothetical protein
MQQRGNFPLANVGVDGSSHRPLQSSDLRRPHGLENAEHLRLASRAFPTPVKLTSALPISTEMSRMFFIF